MKRNRPEGGRFWNRTTSDIRKNYTPEQLQAIGEVIIAWNELESRLNLLIGTASCIPPKLYLDITSRINGIDGKIEILARINGFYRIAEDEIINTLAAFKECKGYRDGVAHATITDTGHGIGEYTKRQAQTVQVILTVEALNGLYDRLEILQSELICIAMIWNLTAMDWAITRKSLDFSEEDRLRLAPEAQADVVQLQEHQNRRRSLLPLPGFPKSRQAPPLAEAAPTNIQS